MDGDAVTATIAGIIGAILGAGGVTPIIIAFQKSRRDLVLDSQVFATKQFDRMEKRIASVEASEKECRATNSVLSKQLGQLTEEVEQLKLQLEGKKR